MTRGRVIAAMVGLVVAGAAVAGWTLVGDGESKDRRPSPRSIPSPHPPPTAPAAAFRVVYRVEDTAGPQARIMTSVVAMRRPYEARIEQQDGPPPGGTVLGATVTNQKYEFALSSGEQEDYGFEISPATAPQTYSEPALRAAAEAGKAAAPGEDVVVGERCFRFVYRQGGTEPLAPGDDTQRVESCVTTDGILLREAVTIGGRRVRLAEATTVDRSPAFAPETFLAGRKPARGGAFGAQQVVAEGKTPKDVQLLLSAVPPGFRLDRRVAVQRVAGPGSPPRIFYNEAFVRGPDLVVTEQLLGVGQSPPWSAEEGSPLDLGRGRTGKVVFHAGSVEVRMTLTGIHARVFAPRLDLAEYCARTMATSGRK